MNKAGLKKIDGTYTRLVDILSLIKILHSSAWEIEERSEYNGDDMAGVGDIRVSIGMLHQMVGKCVDTLDTALNTNEFKNGS